jgi:hypothetical protein
MNTAVIRTHVRRRGDDPNSALALARQRAAEQAHQRAHQAALHVIDVLDAVRQSPPTGPRTATHPMATPIEKDTRGPQEPATSIPDGGTVAEAPDQGQQKLLMALALAAAMIIGLAMGKLL